MNKLSGSFNARKRFPYVYLIMKDKCVYIGETTKYPCSRLHEHLEEYGSFYNNLLEKDPEIHTSQSDIHFISCGLIEFEEYLTANYTIKEILRLMEGELHVLFKCRRNEFKFYLEIISDITRTFPKPNSRYVSLTSQSWYKELLETVFLSFKDFVNQNSN